jgi:hypothetical protein
MEFRSELSIGELKNIMEALFGLLAAADEMSCGIGSAQSTGTKSIAVETRAYQDQALNRLNQSTLGEEFGKRSTLCREIDATRAVVLPKVHTPRNGLTIRNLSNHLAYLRVSDVRPRFIPYLSGRAEKEIPINEHVNLLVVPWPQHVDPVQFRRVASIPLSEEDCKSRLPQYGLFTYNMAAGPKKAYIRALCEMCERRAGDIHGLVFPETSMSLAEFDEVAKEFLIDHGQEGRFLVAGVGGRIPDPGDGSAKFPDTPLQPGTNQAVISYVAESFQTKFDVRYEQSKHHRWKIDGPQIVQYGLGGRLHPNLGWWEFIRSRERTVTFATLRPWLTTSVLVCEDLARPDPVGDALRAVGPNLIVSLLLDGPQLQGRWPGRYATALADDPGSSVLTVTSLGMSKLSAPRPGSEQRSQVVALWKDAKNGVKEINLPQGADAVLLTLSPDHLAEFSADGREKKQSVRSSFPILTGILPIFLSGNFLGSNSFSN